MPADWTLDTLRAEIVKTMVWPGFGLSKAVQRDESGRPVLVRVTGPTEITRDPTEQELLE